MLRVRLDRVDRLVDVQLPADVEQKGQPGDRVEVLLTPAKVLLAD